MGLLSGLLTAMLFLTVAVLAVVGAIRGLQGRGWRYPVIGALVDSL